MPVGFWENLANFMQVSHGQCRGRFGAEAPVTWTNAWTARALAVSEFLWLLVTGGAVMIGVDSSYHVTPQLCEPPCIFETLFGATVVEKWDQIRRLYEILG